MSSASTSALRSRLAALAERAASATAPARRAASAELDKILAANAEYVVKDPVAADKLGKQWLFTNLAR
jgi:F-type H+-transporting ATPase subunit g